MHNSDDKWFKDGVRFRCQWPDCVDCCTGKQGEGYVWVSGDEMEAIAEHLGMAFFDFTRKYVRNVSGAYSLIEKPNHDCVFLENGRCSIYEVRPTQCSTYPFWPDIMHSESTWHAEAKHCPGVNTGDHHDSATIEEKLALDDDA